MDDFCEVYDWPGDVMAELSRTKFNLEVQSLHSFAVRARIQLCRKLVTSIRKLSKTSAKDNNKNEKKSRKVTRLKDEVHCLRHLKPNTISVFALSHSIQSCELLREKDGIESRTRVLAKLSLHKLIKPVVTEFHKKFPNWEKELQNMENGNVNNENGTKLNSEQNVSDSANTSGEEENEGSDEEEESSVGEMSNNVSDNDDEKNIESVKEVGGKALLQEGNNKASSLCSTLNTPSVVRMKGKAASKTKSNLKFYVEDSEVSFKEEEIISTRVSPKKKASLNKWLVEPVEFPMDNPEIKDNEEAEMNHDDSNDDDLDDDNTENDENSLNISEEEENSNVKLGESKNINAINDEDKQVVEKTNSDKTERKLSFTPADMNKNERVSELLNKQKVNECNIEKISEKDDSTCEKLMGKTLEISQTKLTDESQSKKPISSEQVVVLNEDPFFLTKDNQKYMTYGKIVEESKELTLKEPKKPDYESKKFQKNWNEKSFFNKTRDNGKTWKDQRPEKRKSLPEENKVLHPSWEAKRKASTILPFQGKKITFD